MRTFAEKSQATKQAHARGTAIRNRSNRGQRAEVRSILSYHSEQQAAPIAVSPVSGSGLQMKLSMSKPGDQYEKEADRVADQVMRMPDTKMQRACACGGACPECAASNQSSRGRKRLQTKAIKSTDRGSSTAPSIVRDVLSQPGKPLHQSTRTSMEGRFGYDFSQVRVHTDGKAAKSAQSVNARAYTVGSNVVFGSGQYSPSSRSGQHLLAHELTHVVQQSQGGGDAAMMRWSYGTGTVPTPTYVEVPDDEKPRVEAGMRIVSRIVNNPRNYPRCHQRFQDLCPSPSATELVDRYNAARVWKETDTDPTYYYGSSLSPDHIAYTDRTWRIGRWMIANTAIHEMMHRCGHHTEADIDRTAEICGTPEKPY